METTKKVLEFHQLFDHPIGDLNKVEELKVRQLRIKLLFEELCELANAGNVDCTLEELCKEFIKNPVLRTDGMEVDKTEELDALCDLEYVLHGKIITGGYKDIFKEAFSMVHSNNMDKAHYTEVLAQMTIDKNQIEATIKNKNGKFLVIRNDGKLIKPFNHKKVDLSTFINK